MFFSDTIRIQQTNIPAYYTGQEFCDAVRAILSCDPSVKVAFVLDTGVVDETRTISELVAFTDFQQYRTACATGEVEPNASLTDDDGGAIVLLGRKIRARQRTAMMWLGGGIVGAAALGIYLARD